jgi:5-methylcytosine-specific restriction endonuclease McrA
MPEVNCDYCDEQFYKRPSRIENTENDFCSQECYGEWVSDNRSGEDHHQYDRIVVECKNCGSEKEVHPSHHEKVDNHFCGIDCQVEYEDRSGKNNNFWKGGKVSVSCENCGKEKEVQPYRYEEYENFFCDVACRGEWATREFSGENHPLYSNYTENYGTNWLQVRQKVRERDNGKCRVCGVSKEELGKWPDTHHIIPKSEFDTPEKSNFVENLVLLCSECHGKVEQGIIEIPKSKEYL